MNIANIIKTNRESVEEIDELYEIDDIIYSNIDLFLVSFNHEIIFHEENPIFTKYIDTLKSDMMIKTEFDAMGYTKKIINFYFSKNFFDYFIIENLKDEEENRRKYLKNFEEKRELIRKFDLDKKFIFKDYSALLLMEFISTEIDLSTICNNFYYRDVLNKNSKNTLSDLIDKLNDDKEEKTNYEQMKNFITFIKENVIFKWHVEEQRNIFNEYYFNKEHGTNSSLD